MHCRLESLGYKLDLDELIESAGETVGRPHFASFLVKHYPEKFPTVASVFEQLLQRGAPAYIPRILPDPAKAIEEIHAAGGIAILAHPIYRQTRESSWARQVLKKLVPCGLDGIEAYYSTFTPLQTELLQKLAVENNLVLSGGSDYHGSRHPDLHLGCGSGNLHVPGTICQALQQRASKYKTNEFDL